MRSHPEIWEPLGRAARAHIESFYDIEKLNDELVEIYESLL
jgi:colanic acid/amylovoran biosynthesis glycosyltransferase